MSIHPIETHPCDRALFLGGKTWLYVDQAGESRTDSGYCFPLPLGVLCTPFHGGWHESRD